MKPNSPNIDSDNQPNLKYTGDKFGDRPTVGSFIDAFQILMERGDTHPKVENM